MATRNTRLSTLLLVAVGLLMAAGPAQADTCTYTARASGSWNDPNTWDSGYVPGGQNGHCSDGTNVVIPSPDTVSVAPAKVGGNDVDNGSALSVSVQHGATLAIAAGTYPDNSQTVESALSFSATLTNDGTITFASAAPNYPAIIGGGYNGTLLNQADGVITAADPTNVVDHNRLQNLILVNHGRIESSSGLFQLILESGTQSTSSTDGSLVADTGSTLDLADNGGSGAQLVMTGGTVTANGTVVEQTGAGFVMNGGTLNGTNPVTVESAFAAPGGTGTFDAQNSAQLIGDVGAGIHVTVEGVLFDNAPGAVHNRGVITLGGPSTTSGAEPSIHSGTFDNQGTLVSPPSASTSRSIYSTFSNEGTIALTAPLGVNSADYNEPWTNSGTITGNSTLSPGGLLTNAGTIAPSPTPSTLTIGGDLTHAAGGRIAVGIGAAGSSLVHVTGTATLGGSLLAAADAGLNPVGPYTVLNDTKQAGTFGSVSAPAGFSAGYAPTSVVLVRNGGGGVLGSTPRPGTPHVGKAKASGSKVTLTVSCTGIAACPKLTVRLTVTETLRGHQVIAYSARTKTVRKVVTLSSTSVHLAAGKHATVTLKLSHAGAKLLKHRHKLAITLSVLNGKKTISHQTLRLKG